MFQSLSSLVILAFSDALGTLRCTSFAVKSDAATDSPANLSSDG